ncbi:unnamed protein product [Chrysoparadoxa australica]
MSTIGFVSTSVLQSSDGIDFDKEERVESAEVKEAERRAREAANKPLWAQLAEREEKRQQEQDAITKAIFAPPKSLDEDESRYLNEVEDERKKKKEQQAEWEGEQVRKFAAAQAGVGAKKVAAEGAARVNKPSSVIEGKAEVKEAAPEVTIVRKKRRKGAGEEKKKKHKKKHSKTAEKGKDKGSDGASNTPGGNLLGLGDYGSEDESD